MAATYHCPGSPMHGWPLQRRETGLLEAVCEHGVGHPIPESAARLAARYGHSVDTWTTHGCCGCEHLNTGGETMAEKKRIPFGGYQITFAGCKETLEELFGPKPIPPSAMTKALWSYVKRKKLAGK